MCPTNYNRIAFALSALLLATPLLAQDNGKSAPVQEDPILRSIDRSKPAEETLMLPSDPDRSTDRKVQEDLLLSGLNEEPRNTARADIDRQPPAPEDKPEVVDSAVDRDPVLQTNTGQEVTSDVTKDRVKRPKRSERKQQEAEPQGDRDSRLIPKPKESSVQEDPLLRSIDPRG